MFSFGRYAASLRDHLTVIYRRYQQFFSVTADGADAGGGEHLADRGQAAGLETGRGQAAGHGEVETEAHLLVVKYSLSTSTNNVYYYHTTNYKTAGSCRMKKVASHMCPDCSWCVRVRYHFCLLQGHSLSLAIRSDLNKISRCHDSDKVI